ncbi:MAG: Ig-like domain-containing protein [Gemmatimonadales bacterium]|nr:Ig-like domain-containing protein [Gemmatimonadales bacterium]
MQWRSARVWGRAVPLLAAIAVAGCSQDGPTGPRIASLSIASPNPQTGPIGGLLPQPLTVRVVDQRQEPISGAVVTFAVTAGNGILGASSDTSDANGYAQVTFRVGSSVGAQAVAASLPGQTPVSFLINATSAPASLVQIVDGDAQSAQVGAQLEEELVARVTDAFGNPKVGVPLSFTVTSGGGTVSAATVLTDQAGLGKIRWTLGIVAGTQLVSASTGAIPPVTFSATGIPDSPSQIVVVSGGNQVGDPGTALPDSIIVRVVDRFGNGVGGVSVTWTPAQGAGTVSPGSSVTNATGRAATRWTLGGSGGPKSVQVAAGAGVSGTVTASAFIEFATISGGGRSTCAIDEGGVLYCWGFNGDGQLGIGTGPAGAGPTYAVPQSVAPVTNQTFVSLNGGRFHNCAVTFSHNAYCWGGNANGQSGQPNTRSIESPTLVSLAVPFLTISAGRVHTCGVSIGGRAYCWGDNERGQLGGNVDTVANTFVPSSTPVEVGTISGGGGGYHENYPGQNVLDFKSIATGGVHACGVNRGGTAYCWGLGREGQRGDGSNSLNRVIPNVPVLSSATFDAITAGYAHTCARTTTGTVHCWGENNAGQLGNGGNANSNIPVVAGGGLLFSSITAGYSHTCGLAAGGTAFCWGNNSRGQLGNGSTASQNLPVAVEGGLSFVNISAGDFHTCGVTAGGTAYCWGDNEYGALGDGTLAHRSVPTRVRFQR